MQRNNSYAGALGRRSYKAAHAGGHRARKDAQSQRDWQTAHIYVERVIADLFDRYHFCELSRCRRARH